MKDKILEIITLVVLLITAISSFTPSSCKRYVSNTYLYLLSSFLIIASLIKYYEITPSTSKITDSYKNHKLVFAIVMLLLFIAILYTPSSQLFIKHIMWFIFLIMSAILTYHLVSSVDSEKSNTVKTTVFATILLFAIVTLFTTFFKEKLRDAVFSWVMIGLFVGLAVASIFIQKGTIASKVITIAILGILCYSLLVETKDLLLKEDSCSGIDGGGIPDYIDSSVGFFVTIENIFARLLQLQN